MNAKTALFALALAASFPAASLAAEGPPPPTTTARASAPIDLTGQWVSVVTEDWRWRMVTPPKGDYASLPLNVAGRAAADAWNLAADNAAGPAAQCRAFGVGGITRIPGRMRIAWADDATLRVEYDAGQQTRTLRFINQRPTPLLLALSQRTPPQGDRTLQGETRAQWFKQPQFRGNNLLTPSEGGALQTFTLNHTGGYLRKNGVPYSPDALVTERWHVFKGMQNDEWLVITTIVEDPRYLNMPFLTSTTFKKETDTSKWSPQPCRTAEPLAKPVAPRPAAGAPAPAAPAAPRS